MINKILIITSTFEFYYAIIPLKSVQAVHFGTTKGKYGYTIKCDEGGLSIDCENEEEANIKVKEVINFFSNEDKSLILTVNQAAQKMPEAPEELH